jgi:hypothetical protein
MLVVDNVGQLLGGFIQTIDFHEIIDVFLGVFWTEFQVATIDSNSSFWDVVFVEEFQI